MQKPVFVFDPTVSDKQSKVRGVGRYLQILKENFPSWIFADLLTMKQSNHESIFINPFFNFLQPPLLMRRIAQKQIAVIHDLIPLKYPKHFPIGIKGKLNVFLNKLSLKNYDRIITDSEESKNDVVEILKIPEDKISVVYPCLPKVFQNKEIKKLSNKVIKESNKNPHYSITQLLNYCLYVGDATWNKNLVNLVKAIKILNVTCVFVGKVFENLSLEARNLKLDNEVRSLRLDNLNSNIQPQNPTSNFQSLTSKFPHPWQKELKEFFKEIDGDRRFILAGFVSDQELIQLYQQAKVNLLPSRDEGFGFSYVEAASQHCPSVLADIPVLHKISDDACLFANPNDPHDIANAIGELYWNNDKRKQISAKAYKRSLFFSPANFKKTFLYVIETL